MPRTFIVAAAGLAFLGVALGAFGAHGLTATLTANQTSDTYHTATEYQMVHALALLGVAWVSTLYPGKWLRWAGYLFIAGVVLFSGSLYILAVFNLRIMGAVAPLGGIAFLAGWACLGWAAWRVKP